MYHWTSTTGSISSVTAVYVMDGLDPLGKVLLYM